MKLAKLRGVLTALATPFDSKNRVNATVLRELARYNLSMGASGFFVNGTTAECFSLSPQERMRNLEIIKSETGENAGLIVNISHMEFDVVKELAHHARHNGVNVVAALPPLYFPVTKDDIVEYYLALLNSIPSNLVFYNFPALSGRTLEMSMVLRLAEHPQFLGMKNSTDDAHLLSQVKQIDNGRLMVWSSRDASYVAGLSMGADGTISGLSNLMSDLYVDINRAFDAGDLAEALAIQTKVNALYLRLVKYGAIRSIKRCYSMLGMECGECRMPFQPLPPEAEIYLRDTLELLEQTRKELVPGLPENSVIAATA